MDLFRHRPIRAGDFAAAQSLLTQDRELFSTETWSTLPQQLESLLAKGRLHGGVVEDLAGTLCFCGVTAFARTNAIAPIAHSAGFRESLLRHERTAHPLLLNQRALAQANAEGDLALIHLFGCADSMDPATARTAELHRLAFEAFLNHHAGYRLAELWQEAVHPTAILFLQSMGVPAFRRYPLPSGAEGHLFCFTRADAATRPGNPLAPLMKFQPPRLGFTRAQQRLLAFAIHDVPDRLAATQLAVTEAAIKKRWRSIYDRVEQIDTRLAPVTCSGPERRRMLLLYLRQHPEELRPYAPAAASTC
ncbi:MAG: hypothetical protein JNK87_18205 [Bryobacterales bacterium]|nr:hypothetical protein [Bryobacterales bacterium]